MCDGVIRTLCDVRHVHDLRKNMILFGTLDGSGFNYKSSNEVMKVSKGVLIVMKGQRLVWNIYKLMGTIIVGGAATVEPELDSTALWHIRLGHMSERGMMKLHKRKLLKGIKTFTLDFCKYCVFGKQNKVQFKTSTHKTKGILNYVYTDVWGLVQIASLGGSVYFMSFIDDYSQKFWVYFMEHKSITFAKFKLWKDEMENHT